MSIFVNNVGSFTMLVSDKKIKEFEMLKSSREFIICFRRVKTLVLGIVGDKKVDFSCSKLTTLVVTQEFYIQKNLFIFRRNKANLGICQESPNRTDKSNISVEKDYNISCKKPNRFHFPFQ